jgi:hypothetical protein
MHWCAQHCMTLRLDKGPPLDKPHYGSQALGSIVVVQKFTRESVVMLRTDYGRFPGRATLTGKLSADGNRIVDGTIEWTYHPGGLSTGKFQAAWGTAINSVPGSDAEREALSRSSAPASGEVQSKLPSPGDNAGSQPREIGNTSSQSPPSGDSAPKPKPAATSGAFDLNGIWETETPWPAKKRIRIQQFGTHVKAQRVSQAGLLESEIIFSDDYQFASLVGRALSDPKQPSITVLDPDLLSVAGQGKFERTTGPVSDDVRCSEQNTSHVRTKWAFIRGEVYAQVKRYDIATCWYRIAALEGHPKSQAFYGYSLLIGRGAPKNESEAFLWFKKAADQNDFYGETMVARCYYDGVGVAEDRAKADFWMQKAIKQEPRSAEAVAARQSATDSQVINALMGIALDGLTPSAIPLPCKIVAEFRNRASLNNVESAERDKARRQIIEQNIKCP